MTKIVLVGAGSHVFSSRLITDIVSYPELRDSTISLMTSRLNRSNWAAFAHKIVAQNNFRKNRPQPTGGKRSTRGFMSLSSLNAVNGWKRQTVKLR